MDTLTAFGLFAVTAMAVCYALEDRSHWYVLAFAGACALGSAYGLLQGAWPFGVVEAIWALWREVDARISRRAIEMVDDAQDLSARARRCSMEMTLALLSANYAQLASDFECKRKVNLRHRALKGATT